MDKPEISLKKELAAIHARIRAKALLIAIDWAGSASTLAELAGLSHNTGTSWLKRGRISVDGAKRLERVYGFPLTVEEMCPGQRTEPYVCKHCHHVIALQGERTGCLPSFNGRSKAYRDALRKKREHAARAAKRKQQTPTDDSA